MVLTSVRDASLRRFSTPPLWHVDAVGERPTHHYKTTTVTAALRTSSLVATTRFDRVTNRHRFCSYVANSFVSVLRPGNTVILDNLQALKVAGVREAGKAVGARIR